MSWRRFFGRAWWGRERACELASYLEIETAENLARGMTVQDAEAAARRKLGNRTSIQEEIYRVNTLTLVGRFLAGSAPRRAHAVPEPGVCMRGRSITGARRGSEYSDFSTS